METERNEIPGSTSMKEVIAVELPCLTGESKHDAARSKKDPSVSSSLSTESTSDDVISQESSIVFTQNGENGSPFRNRLVYPLRRSLFVNVPPHLNFTLSDCTMRKLPKEIRNVLRWKRSERSNTSLITEIIRRSGFVLTNDNSMWISVWRRQMKCHRFRKMEENQKVNHFPGTFHLGHKDKIWLNIVRMQELNGKEEFSFMPQTFILPQDLIDLREAWARGGSRTRWIIKPPSSARGNGISIIHRWEDIPETEPVIAQRYITYPYLINGTKFDVRLYVLVTSFDPLRAYIFEDGIVRFATEKYSKSLVNLNKNFVHLTNYSVNRSNSSYKGNEDVNVPQGHKWGLKCLWSYFQQMGVDDRKIWNSLIDIVVKTLISCEEPINKLIKLYAKNRYCCYELFGFDLILDYMLKPWLLEVNVTPSLQVNSQLDYKIKGELVKDMLNLVGFHIPKECKLKSSKGRNMLQRMGINAHSNISWNKILYDFALSYEERIKQFKFRTGISNEANILKSLTPDDVRQLVQSEDELARCGQFVRIFPTETSFVYLKFFENIKYYNLLLSAWERKYYGRRKVGILNLQAYCGREFHLQNTDGMESEEQRSEQKMHKETSLSTKANKTETEESALSNNENAERDEENILNNKSKLIQLPATIDQTANCDDPEISL